MSLTSLRLMEEYNRKRDDLYDADQRILEKARHLYNDSALPYHGGSGRLTWGEMTYEQKRPWIAKAGGKV